MKVCTELPKSYQAEPVACIELEKSRLLSRLIKTVQAVLAVVLLFVGGLMLPFSALTEFSDPFEHLAALMLGMLSVSIVQELGRGLLMRLFSGVKPVLRFAGAYLHAGCEAYFPRREEQIVNLLPPLLTAIVILVLFFTTADATWRWMIWIILIVDLCFCVGYGYASLRFTQLPEDILVQNVGSTYLVYSAGAPT